MYDLLLRRGLRIKLQRHRRLAIDTELRLPVLSEDRGYSHRRHCHRLRPGILPW